MNAALPADYYTQVMAVINKVSQGVTVTRACFDIRIPVATFNKYVASQPELVDMFGEAKQMGNDALADALINIDSDPHNGQSDAKMAAVVSGNIKWLLERRDAQRYGKTMTVEHKVTADKAVIDALDRAKQRAISDVIEDVEYMIVDSTTPATMVVAGVELDGELAEFL